MSSSGAPRSARPGPNGAGISGRAAAVLVALGALAATKEPARAAGAPFSEIVAVVHLHTSLADGSSTPTELARAARAAGVDALLLTDHLLEKVSYAPWPLGRIVGVTLSRPSVMTLGIDRYLGAAAEAEREVPGVIVIPGVEATPYARWSGSALAGNLELRGWHRHLLLVGLDDPSVIAALPVLGNRAGGDYNAWSLLFVLPVVVVIWSVRRIVRPASQEARVGRFILRRSRRPIAAALLGACALLVIIAGFPYRVERFGPVGPDPGDAPFRRLVDVVRAQGGVSIWAHPEASAQNDAIRGIRMDTEPYADLVLRIDADGFGALPEGVKTLLPIGGLWDRALEASLARSRPGTPFALAESDEHRSARDIDFGSLQTVLLAREKSRAGILEALRAGRLYGRWTPAGQPPLRLADFHVEGEGATGEPGRVLAAAGPVVIHLAIQGGNGSPVTARLVREGHAIWTVHQAPPIQATIADSVTRPTYYRLDVEGVYPYRLVGNPAVVVPPREKA